MQLLKFNLLFIIGILFSSNSHAMFEDMECINSSFDISISHKGFPFGLTEDVLTINKNSCVIEIGHQTMKFFNKKWTVDVCRGPVHIKYGTGSVDVVKKNDDAFFGMMERIFKLVQDDGLIFAKGEKENLNSNHGRVYCSFLLLKAYLESGNVISRDNSYSDFLSKWYQKGSQNPQRRFIKNASESVPSFKVEGVGVPVTQPTSKGMPIEDEEKEEKNEWGRF